MKESITKEIPKRVASKNAIEMILHSVKRKRSRIEASTSYKDRIYHDKVYHDKVYHDR